MPTNKESLQVSYSQPGYTINWGAIFAGLVFIVALGWLTFTLSSAIGLSIFDIDSIQPDNFEIKAESIGITAIAWVIVTAIVTYFLGGFLAGKVSGRTDKPTGTLHGLVLWSCTIILGMVLAAIGVSGIVNTAAGAAKSVASSGMNVTGLLISQKEGVSSDNSSFLHPIIGSLKQGITKAIEKTEKALEDSKNVNSNSSYSRKSDREDNSYKTSADNADNNKSSTEKVSNSSADSENKHSRASDEDEYSNTANDHSDSSTKTKEDYEQSQNEVDDASFKNQVDEGNATSVDDTANDKLSNEKPSKSDNEDFVEKEKKSSSVANNNHSDSRNNDVSIPEKKYRHHHHYYQQMNSSARRIEKAIKNIDPQILNSTAIALIQGDTDRAKEILSNHIDIDEAEIEKVIQIVQEKANKVGKELKAKAESAKEYASGVLWVIFVSYLLGLFASIFGAQMAMRIGNTLAFENDKNT